MRNWVLYAVLIIHGRRPGCTGHLGNSTFTRPFLLCRVLITTAHQISGTHFRPPTVGNLTDALHLGVSQCKDLRSISPRTTSRLLNSWMSPNSSRIRTSYHKARVQSSRCWVRPYSTTCPGKLQIGSGRDNAKT